MKKIIQFLLILATINCYSQDVASLKVGAKKVYDYTTNQNYVGLLEMSYPKLFEIVTKTDMIAMLKKTFDETEGYKIIMIPSEPNFVFGEIKKIDKQLFCVINHDITVQMIFDEPIPTEEIQEYITVFKENMSSDNVTYDTAKKTMTIISKSKLIAISDETTKNEWRFLTYNNNVFDMMFTPKIKTELGL